MKDKNSRKPAWRCYEIKRFDEANIRRSLDGAQKRTCFPVILGIQTKQLVLPEGYERDLPQEGGCYFGCYYDEVKDGVLQVTAEWTEPNHEGVFSLNTLELPLDDIEALCVRYEENCV